MVYICNLIGPNIPSAIPQNSSIVTKSFSNRSYFVEARAYIWYRFSETSNQDGCTISIGGKEMIENMKVIGTKWKARVQHGNGRLSDLNESRPEWLDVSRYPFTSRYVNIEGNEIHYIDEGTGPTILFLHSNVIWSFIYRNVIKTLRNSFRCVELRKRLWET